MTKHNPENERIKRKHFAYLKEAKRHSEQTVDAAAKAMSPEKRPTQEWVSCGQKHKIRYQAMIDEALK